MCKTETGLHVDSLTWNFNEFISSNDFIWNIKVVFIYKIVLSANKDIYFLFSYFQCSLLIDFVLFLICSYKMPNAMFGVFNLTFFSYSRSFSSLCMVLSFFTCVCWCQCLCVQDQGRVLGVFLFCYQVFIPCSH